MAPGQFFTTTRAVQLYQQMYVEPYKGPRQAFWIYGDPGVGKSRYCKAFGPFIKASNKWWDGYTGHDTVLIDDVEKDAQFLGHFLKLWADPYGDLDGEIKGGRTILGYKQLYVTSNYSPKDIFGHDE